MHVEANLRIRMWRVESDTDKPVPDVNTVRFLCVLRRRSHLEEIFVTSCLLDKLLSIIVTPSTSVVNFFAITNYPIGWFSVSCFSCFTSKPY